MRELADDSELAAKEWRMYADCPLAELELCWWYEYTREARRGSPVQLPLFPDRGEEWAENQLFPEWPAKAYLSIPALEREVRLQQLKGGSADYVRSRALMPPFPGGYLTAEQAKAYLEGFRIFELSEDSKGQQMLGPKHDWPIREISDAGWIALFRIDWRRSDSEVLADFMAWLKVHRPEAFPSPIGKKGAGSSSRQWQAELKALGALRLLDFYVQRQNIPLPAAELYDSRFGWMTAQQKAKKRLKFFQL